MGDVLNDSARQRLFPLPLRPVVGKEFAGGGQGRRDLINQRLQAEAGQGGNGQCAPVGKGFAQPVGQSIKAGPVQKIDFAQHQPCRPLRQRRTVGPELGFDGGGVGQGVGAVGRTGVDEMQQQASAGEVAQKLRAEAGALGGAGNQAGNVRHDEARVRRRPHRPEIRRQGGEGIAGHLGPSRRNHGQQGRFAGVGHAQQADIGQQAQLQN